MQPQEYLLLLAGLGLGTTVGFLLAVVITAGRIRYEQKKTWASAERFYARRFAEMIKQ